jgi:hypothetical protein
MPQDAATFTIRIANSAIFCADGKLLEDPEGARVESVPG